MAGSNPKLSEEQREVDRLKAEIIRLQFEKKDRASRRRIITESARLRQEAQELEAELAYLQEEDEEDIEEDERPRKYQRGDTIGDQRIISDLEDPFRSRALLEAASIRYRPHPKIKELPPYKGKGIAEAQAFIQQAERRFRQDKGRDYPEDTDKILFCVSAFETGAERRWSSYEETRGGLDNITWEDFKQFLEGTIGDPTGLLLHASDKYTFARQKEGQPIDDFVVYLESLERQLGLVDDKQRCLALYSRLHPQLKKNVNVKDEVPMVREKLINLCRRLERGLRNQGNREGTFHIRGHTDSAPKPQREPDQGSEGPASSSSWKGYKKEGFSSANRTPLGRQSDSRTCYRCHATGHFANKCPEIKCHNCDQKGHTAPDCTKPKRTGNGEAQR
jgi:hypothetical protein